jgi:3-methyladenine DNA glycosylase/8-oxoguanine DNA glycosylase
LGRFIERAGPFGISAMPMSSTFEYLCRAIIYQQLSTKAAATIHGRLRDLFPRRRVSASLLLSMPDEALRGAGLSRAKVAAVKDLAAHAAARRLPTRTRMDRMDDEAVIETLTRVRGIGRWTVEMLLMFPLGRPDVLPVTDLGVQKGFRLVFGGDELPTPAAVYSRGERWRPYRSVASWYMYRAVHMERGD